MDREPSVTEAPGDERRAALPASLKLLLSAVILVHFAAISINILGEVSGPWPNLGGMGVGLGEPPAFLTEGMVQTARDYAFGVRLGETGRFPSNRLQPLQVRLEAVLFNESGEEIGARQLPDPKSLPWNRAREQLIAQALANDVIKPNPGPDLIPPPGQEPTRVPVWRLEKPGDTAQRLVQVPLHQLTRPPDPPDWGPSDWGLTLSRSYAVHLCRATGAASVEIRRHWRNQPAPFIIQSDNTKLGSRDEEELAERTSVYGKVSDAR